LRYLLDTDHISLIQRKQSPEYGAILAHSALHSPADILTYVVSFHEQVLGCQTYLARAKTIAEIVHGYDMLSRVIGDFGKGIVLPFDGSAGATFDRLVANKVRIPTMDLRIAATALASGAILVTRNSRHFAKVPGLVLEDWTR
jgi:tRNA(fMet)-specific endonuclease VapC